MITKLFDSHCHFDFPAFDSDRFAVWQQALNRGVSGLFIPGVHRAQWGRAATTVQQLRELGEGEFLYGAGLHPWWVLEWLESVEACTLHDSLRQLSDQVRKAASSHYCCAIGEVGLDTMLPSHKAVDIDIQRAVVVTHLQIAHELSFPVILHCRKAHNELIQLLDEYPLKACGILHGFTGSAELAMEYWRRGFCIGVGGSITYPRANKTRAAIKSLPNEALVLETDAPDMPLCGKQGERNSPEYLPLVAAALAELRNQPIEMVADYCYQNTCRVFAV